MKRILLACALVMLLTGTASATVYDFYWAEYNGVYLTPSDPYPQPAVPLGSMAFNPIGEIITGATITGTWGNSTVASSSAVDVYLNGLLVGQNLQYGPGYYNLTPWSYTYTAPDFATLSGGFLDLTAIQTSEYYIRLGETHMQITTTSAVPDASTLTLAPLGLMGLWGLRRRFI